MRRKVRKMDCIEYLSVQAPLEKVNMLEDKQSKYIHDFAKKSEYCIVGKMRRNGFSQRDVDRQWMQIVNMIRKKQIKGVVVANMAAVSSSVADAYYKVGLINEAGGVVVTVDEGRYRMRFSAPTYGNSYLYSYANIIKTDELSLPLYVLPYYPYSSGSQHFFGFALGICKLCLTTINNLSEPVRKLDGQVMKITYDIVDE